MQLVFGEVIYRAQFADSASLVECVEKEVKKLSGLIADQDKSKNR